jgi:hypothetical protein
LTVRESDPERAFRMLTLVVMNDPRSHDGAAALWELAEDLGRVAAVAPMMLRSIGHQLRAGDKDAAVEQWIEVLRAAAGARGEPRVLVRLTQELVARGRRDDALATVRLATLCAGSDPDPLLALAIGRAAVHTDPGTARALLERLLRRQDLDPDTRSNAERMLAGCVTRAVPAP